MKSAWTQLALVMAYAALVGCGGSLSSDNARV